MRDAAALRRQARAAQARADIGVSVRRGVLFGAALMALVLPLALHPGRQGAVAVQVGAATAITSVVKPVPRRADFAQQSASPDARQLADWVADSRDHADSAFVIVDKKHATVHVFDAAARLRGSTPVLLGAAAGDDSVAGIGARAIADVKPHERITPAGRFVAERGHNALGEDVVWVDYDAAVSMHRVRTTNPGNAGSNGSHRPASTTTAFPTAASTCPRRSTTPCCGRCSRRGARLSTCCRRCGRCSRFSAPTTWPPRTAADPIERLRQPRRRVGRRGRTWERSPRGCVMR